MIGVELYTNYHLGFMETNAAAQKICAMEHPLAFFMAMINSLVEYKLWYMTNFIGSWGFLWNVNLSLLFYELYLIILIFFALTSGLKVKIFERGVLIFAAAVAAFAFFFVHYLKWTPVGADYVKGVQGRYFIPIALMIFAALSILPLMRHKNLIALVAGIFSGINMLLTNFSAFY